MLYALFILEANYLFAHQIKGLTEEEIIHRVLLCYFNQWVDRAVCEEVNKEYSGFVSKSGIDWIRRLVDPEFEADEWFPVYIHKSKKDGIDNEIKFRFVGEK